MNDPQSAAFALDRRAMVRAFDRAAADYDAAAGLQRYAQAELMQRLQYFALEPHRILDLGAGTCRGALALARRYPRARILAIDLAHAMLAAAPRGLWWRRRRFERICADAYRLPLPDRRADLIYSNLMLQWCDQPQALFQELARVLRPGGLLLFSSFGPDTLTELRAAWATVDSAVHVNEFQDMPQLGEALTHAGFIEPVIDAAREIRYYPEVRALMRELKRIGAHNVARARARGLTGPARLRAMSAAYERVRAARGLPATYELLFGAAFAGGAARGMHEAAQVTEYVVPAATVRRRG